MIRKVLLLTIDAGPLPTITPIVPVTTTPTVDGHTSLPLPAPTGLTILESFDSVIVSWTAPAWPVAFLVETAPAAVGPWTPFAATSSVRYIVPLSATAWVRVRSSLNGLLSAPSVAIACNPRSSSALSADAAAALAAATAAAADAAAASAAIASVTSDDVLSRAEKTGEVIRWASAQGELTDIRTKADTFGISRAAYDAAYNTLNSYIAGLTPAFGDMTQDTPISGATYRTNWLGYLDQRTLLLNAIAEKAKVLADTAQAAANAAASAAATAQTTADNAQATATSAVMSASAAAAAAAAAKTSADAANAQLAAISSDAILSAAEKPPVILQYQTILNEKAGIEDSADAYGVTTEKTAYQTAISNLTAYLSTLTTPTHWNDTSGDTSLGI